ncbi:hypothetical protein ACF0H5_021094 [Mactra antiquata]
MIPDLEVLIMSKRQKTSCQRGKEKSSTSTSEKVNAIPGMSGTMITAQSPPNINIIEFSDTISDVEEDEYETESPSHCDSTRKRKRAKRHKKKVKDRHKKHDKEGKQEVQISKSHHEQSHSSVKKVT